MYDLGDFARGSKVHTHFTTHGKSGADIDYTGGEVRVYKDDDATQSTSGVTTSVGFDSTIGLHHVEVDTGSSPTFYSHGSQFAIVLHAVTIDGETVTAVIGRFTLGLEDLYSCKAQAGANASVTLDTGASTVNDFHNGDVAEIVGGTGKGQSRRITDYVGLTKVATVNENWVTNPDNTSIVRIVQGERTSLTITGGDASAANQATIESKIDTVDTVVDAIKVVTDLFRFTGNDVRATLDGEEVTPTTASKTGYALSATGTDLVTVHGKKLRELIGWCAAVLYGKVAGAEQTGPHTETFKGPDGTTVIVSVDVDDDGNRTAITLTSPGT